MTTLTLPQSSLAPAPKRWTVPQFHRLWEQGHFDGRKAMLLNGEIIETLIPQDADAQKIGALVTVVLVRPTDDEIDIMVIGPTIEHPRTPNTLSYTTYRRKS